MEDPHRQPRDQDRKALADRIRRAAEEGRIVAADRDIRLANIASAQSVAELDLIARDLDQLESALPASVGAAPAAVDGWAADPGTVEAIVTASPRQIADQVSEAAVDMAKSTARSIGVAVAVILAVVLVGAGAAALFAFGSETENPISGLQDPLPVTPGEDVSDLGDDPKDPPAGTAYALTGPGIRAFLRLYEKRFGTTVVVDLTMYDDYVVVDVPVPGKARHQGWLYRKDSGFTTFGKVTANFPGAQPVDTRGLAIPALVRNLTRARGTLNVEEPTTTYVIVNHFNPNESQPSVDIHVANEFNESGYLATRMDGQVERAYPYGG